MSNKQLLVRVEAGAAVGTGHFMRCLALAEAWGERGGAVAFATSTDIGALAVRLRDLGIDWLAVNKAAGSDADARQTAQLAREYDCVLLDGYSFGATFQETLARSGVLLAVIDDDAHAGYYSADVIINQNRHASAELYADRSAHTKLLLGTDYVLLRSEYRRWAGALRRYGTAGVRVLVTFGGSDPTNATSKTLRALRRLDRQDTEVTVVVGAANPHAREILPLARDLDAEVVRDARNMAELIGGADLAVASGGSTVWEFLFMRTHALLGATVPVEELLIAGVADQPSLSAIGWYSDVAEQQLAAAIGELIERRPWGTEAICGGGLIDGRGAERVVAALTTIEVTA